MFSAIAMTQSRRHGDLSRQIIVILGRLVSVVSGGGSCRLVFTQYRLKSVISNHRGGLAAKLSEFYCFSTLWLSYRIIKILNTYHYRSRSTIRHILLSISKEIITY